MEPVPGARTFEISGAAYDGFMGRYSRPLSELFADLAGVTSGRTALDVGCGPGALTSVLADRLGGDAVFACDPSPSFVEACVAACPDVEVRMGRAEAIPFEDACVDIAVSQLVLHFVSDPAAAAGELRRVVRPGGMIAACVWDFDKGMQMLRHFWDAALAIDASAPDESRVLRFGREGEIPELFEEAGLADVTETTLQVEATYGDFEELWAGFLAGVGPAGSYCVGLDEPRRKALRQELFQRCGSPTGSFALSALARCATGVRR